MLLNPDMGAINTIIFIIIFLGATENGAKAMTGPHIADVNVLLPPKLTHPVEYRLLGTGACFKWSWDHHDILSVVPEYNESSHCSTSARLRSIAPYTGRRETAVYAADIHTGFVVRCKVYIDMFTRIQIFHSSVKLDLDGLATLQVRAFDSEENVFSSLVGLTFMWQLMPESEKAPHHLVHVPLCDSPLSDCSGFCGDLDVQIELEDSGMFSDLLVVKGTEIGHEVVAVQLLEPQFGNMTDKIVLTVAEAMSLDPPSPVLVLVGAIVQYTLKVIRGNVPQEVPLPSAYHRWSASNSFIAQVDERMGIVHALELGETSILVEDTRVAGHIQISSLNVVLPDYMSLYLLPLSKFGNSMEGVEPIISNACWYIVSGRPYLVKLKVLSRGDIAREIYITENDDLKLDYDQPGLWKNLPISDSDAVKFGWHNSRILVPISQGLGKLSATLTFPTDYLKTKEALKVLQDIMVCDQVRVVGEGRNISLSSILLPWSPDVYQEAELRAVGGCAKTAFDYRWVSSDNDIVSVSALGAIQAKRPGKAFIKVFSTYDSFNFDELAVEVSIPASMVMLRDYPVETVVGSHMQAAVGMKSLNGDYFYQCDAFGSSIKWLIESDSFVIVNSLTNASLKKELHKIELSKSDYDVACARAHLYAASPGEAILHASFSKHVDDGLLRQIMLKASTPIASFSPLLVYQAGDGNKFGGYWFDFKRRLHDGVGHLKEIYLAPGALLDLLLIGGPKRWGKGVEFIETIDINCEQCLVNDGVFVYQVPVSELNGYRIECREPGNFTLTFKRANLIGDDHPQPAIAEENMQLVCGFPSSIVVLADEPVNKLEAIQNAVQADRGPGLIRSTPVTVANGKTIRVSAIGISNSGKAFANCSTIPLQWELSKCEELASWDEAYCSDTLTHGWERYLALKNSSGQCTVRAVVQSNLYNVHPSSDIVLTDAILLQVVSTLQVFPEFSLVFFNPNAKMNLMVVGGSCFLETMVNDSRIVEVEQPLPGLHCSQMTMVPRGVGTALVTVYDVGLSPAITAASVVKVADMDWLKIMSGEVISLMEGSTYSVVLSAGTDDGNTFDSSQYAYMNIRVHVDDNVLDLVDGDNLSTVGDGYIYGSSFTIYGKIAGVTTLYVSAQQQSGQEIYSQSMKVEVYNPPVLHPSEIFLVPGASYLLDVKGGPQIGVVVEYTSMNESTVAIQGSFGRLFAISPGDSTIVATFGSGQKVLCQAYGKVKVGVPSAAVLNVQSEQIAVGLEMPVFPLLVEGDLFSFYELCNNYNWTIENEKVLTFDRSEDLNGNDQRLLKAQSANDDEQDLNFIKVLHGRSGGRSTVSLTFSCDFASHGTFSYSMSYSASASIRVVPDPPLADGMRITWIFPPHYTTSDLLPAHSGSHSQRDMQGQSATVSYSILGCCGRKDEDLQKGVISISGSKIKTTDSNNLACVQAQDHSTGRIEIASCVRVAEVSQIRFVKNLGKHVLYLSVGVQAELPVDYYDNLGNRFHEARNVVIYHVETNYQDILNIVSQKNGSTVVKALRHGQALVGVRFDGNTQKSDYIRVSVGAHIHPQSPVLRPGSHVNLNIEGLNDKVSGRWLSGNESIISVDFSTGRVLAVGEGTTSVIFQSSSLKLQTTVRVLNEDVIFVEATRDTLTNVFYPLEGYNFLVKFRTHKFGARSRSIEDPYDCEVEPAYIGYAIPWKDLATGDFYCRFFPYSPEHLERSVPKSTNRRPDISISIHAKLREVSELSGSTTALFVGGFSILEIDKDSLQLNLTSDSNSSIITLVGNTDVGIYWLNQDLMTVRNLFKGGSGISGRAQYEIKVIKSKPFVDKLIFTLPAIGQRVELDINYVGAERKTSKLDIASSNFAVLILSLAALVYVLVKHFRAHQSVSPSAPDVTLQTPERSTHALSKEQSPQTPQPFIEYVRRTIDETPYYRRGARRRFDPQNTY